MGEGRVGLMRIEINDPDLDDERFSFTGTYKIRPTREVLIDGIKRDVTVRFTTSREFPVQIAVDDVVVEDASVYVNGLLVASSKRWPERSLW